MTYGEGAGSARSANPPIAMPLMKFQMSAKRMPDDRWNEDGGTGRTECILVYLQTGAALHEVATNYIQVGLNGMCTDCHECFCSAGGYHTWCLFSQQACWGLLGVRVTGPICRDESGKFHTCRGS